MAGTSKYGIEPNRKAVAIPFADGVQDPRLGTTQNTMLFKQKDIFNGDFKYFTQRPSFHLDVEYVDLSTGFTTTVGRPRGSFLWGAYPILFAENNIFLGTDGYQGNPVLTGADITLYRTSTNIVSAGLWENVSNGAQAVFTPVINQQNLFVITDPTLLSYTNVSLGFFPVTKGAAMDGYIFLASGENIYNCNLNDYTTWNIAVNFIAASQIPGSIVALQRHKNYITVLKESSIEYFYNAGLTNTSPLQRNTSYTKHVGCANANTVVEWEDEVFFVGNVAGDAALSVYMVDSNFSLSEISTPEIENYLLTYGKSSLTNSFCFKEQGKSYYVISTKNLSYFYVFDTDEKVWHKWVSTATSSYPSPDSGFGRSFGSSLNSMVFSGATTTTLISSYGKKTKDSYLYTTYSAIPVQTKVPSLDFGTNNRKFMHEVSLSVIAPDTLNHSVSFVKTVGGNRQTITKSTTIGNNMSFKNWGQFVSGYITYTLSDPSASGVAGLDSSEIRVNGLNIELSQGIS